MEREKELNLYNHEVFNSIKDKVRFFIKPNFFNSLRALVKSKSDYKTEEESSKKEEFMDNNFWKPRLNIDIVNLEYELEPIVSKFDNLKLNNEENEIINEMKTIEKSKDSFYYSNVYWKPSSKLNFDIGDLD